MNILRNTPVYKSNHRHVLPQYVYDVFISHNQIDRNWVEFQLLLQLEQAGLKVHSLYLEPGKPKITNIESAIAKSRHVVLIITQEWLDDEWNAYESILTLTSDPSGQQQRLIPIHLRPCQLPAYLAHLTSVDLTQHSSSKAEIARLIQSLVGYDLDLRSEDPVPKSPPDLLQASIHLLVHQVPAPETNFVGRNEIIQNVLTNLDSYKIVSILGIPGIGKTALLRQIAAQLNQGRVFWYEFKPGLLAFENVWIHLARFLESQAEENRYLTSVLQMPNFSEDERIELIINKLNANVYYLFFDGIHHVEPNSAIVTFFNELKLKLQQGLVFVAGREQPKFLTTLDEIRPTVTQIRLDGLSIQETEDFFRQHQITLQRETVAKLHHQLGGLPLALNLMVVLYAESFAESELVELANNAHGKIVEYLFTETYEQLHLSERTMLTLASLFPLPFFETQIIETYRVIYGEPGDKVDFKKLQHRQLIQPLGSELFQIHETIKALAQAFNSDLKQQQNKVADYLAQKTECSYEEHLQAILLYLQAESYDPAAELTTFIIDHEFIPYNPRLAENILRVFKKEKLSPQSWMWLANSKGKLSRYWRKFDEAEEHYQFALSLAQELQDKDAIATLFQNLGILHSKHNGKIAEKYYLDSMALKKEVGDFFGQAQVHNNLGSLYIQQQRFADALMALEHGLALLNANNVPEWQMLSLHGNMGYLYAEQKQWDKAAHFHKRTLQIAENMGDPYEIAMSTYNLGVDADRQDDSELALQEFSKALHIAQRYSLWEIEELVQIAQGKLHYNLGNHDEAIASFNEVAKIQEEIDDKPRLATTYFDIGTFYWHKGELQQALMYYENGIAIFEHLALEQEKVLMFLDNIRRLASTIDKPRQIVQAMKHLKNRLLARPTSYELAEVYATLGTIYCDCLQQNRVGFACIRQSIILFENLEQWQEQVNELIGLGARYEDITDFGNALTAYTKATQISQNRSLTNNLDIALYNQANCFAILEIWPQAEDSYHAALNAAMTNGNLKLSDAIRHNLGESYRRQGRLEEAEKLLLTSLEFARQHENIEDQIRTLNNLGLVYRAEFQTHEALTHFEEALSLCKQHHRNRDEANVLISLGNFHVENEMAETAKLHYEQALSAARQSNDSEMEEASMLSLAYAHQQLGTFNEIAAEFTSLAERADTLKHYDNLIKFLIVAGQINLLNEKEPEAAATSFEQALTFALWLAYERAIKFEKHAKKPNFAPELTDVLGQICYAIENALLTGDDVLVREFQKSLLNIMNAQEHWDSDGSVVEYLTLVGYYLEKMPSESLSEFVNNTWSIEANKDLTNLNN